MNAILYILVLFCWGTTWFAVNLQVQSDVAPLVSVAWRFLLAACFLFIWCVVRGKSLRFPLTYHRNWLLIGLFLFCCNFISIYYSTEYLTSGIVALIFSTITIFIIINGALWFSTPIVMRTMFGSVIGILGLATVFVTEVKQLPIGQLISLDVPQVKGLLWGLLGTFVASLGMLISGKIQARNVPLMQSNAYGMLYGSIITLCIALVTDQTMMIETSYQYLGSLVFLALFGSAVGFGAYLKLLNNIGADKAAYANVFTPIIALTISALLESYQWTITNIIGISLILIGNLVVLYKPKTHH